MNSPSHGLSLKWRGGDLHTLGGHVPAEIIELVARVLIDSRATAGRTAPGAYVLERMGGSRSGAIVLKASPERGGGGAHGLPTIVKVASGEASAREKRNFEEFVASSLPPACRPTLLAHAELAGLAALCFSFLGREREPVSLTELLARCDFAGVSSILSHLVGQLRHSWYSPYLRKTERDLAGYYLDRYFEGAAALEWAETLLYREASRLFGAQPAAQGYRIGEIDFPQVRSALATSPFEPTYLSCVVHGDLNSDNVLIVDDRTVALVDFERTGRGPVYHDFASLEASFRINCPTDDSTAKIWEVERQLALDDPRVRASPYGRAVARLRDGAFRLFGSEEKRSSYRIAVAAIALRLTRAADLSVAARARICASALWSVRTLHEK